MNNDRIAEVYEGTYGSPQQQKIARERIHWLCQNVVGDEVLDVGCSQGIASLLLGREGKRVTGVDRETGAIEEARRRLSREEQPVRDRVTFLEGEGSQLAFPDASFDTILMAEIIEHQIDARPLIEEAHRVLRRDGRLVLTVPYGLFPYPDHKEPIYLGGLLELLIPRFRIDSIELIHHYLALLCAPSRASSGMTVGLLQNALAIAEARLAARDEGFEQQRRRLAEHGRAAAADAPANAVLPRLDELAETLRLADERIDELELERRSLSSRLELTETELDAARALCTAFEQSSEGARTAVVRLRARIEELERGDGAGQTSDGGTVDETSRTEGESLDRRLSELEAELASARARETELTEALEQAQRASSEEARSRVEMRAELTRAVAGAEAAQTAADAANAELDAARREVERLTQRTAILESGLSSGD